MPPSSPGETTASKGFTQVLTDVITSAHAGLPPLDDKRLTVSFLTEALVRDRKGEEDYLGFTSVITGFASSLMIKVHCSSHTDTQMGRQTRARTSCNHYVVMVMISC